MGARTCAGILAAFAAIAADAGAAGPPTGNGNRADVYSGFFGPPDEERSLAAAGEARAEALAIYYDGVRHQLAGNYAAAIDRFREVLEFDPSNIALARETSSLLAGFGRFDEALRLLESSLGSNRDRFRAYLNLSEYCATYHHNNPSLQARSLEIAREALARFPEEPAVYGHLADLYLIEGEREKASEVLERCLARESNDPGFWLRTGRLAQRVWPIRTTEGRSRNLERVNAIYERALAAGGGDATLEAVADFYAASQQYDEGIALYRRLVRERPDDLDAREKLARTLKIEMRHDEALAEFEALVSINPFNGRLREFVATYYAECAEGADTPEAIALALDRVRAAAGHLREAIRLGEDDARNFTQAARFFDFVDETPEALRLLERGAFLYPDDPSFPMERYRIARNQADYPEALASLREAERLISELPSKETVDRFLSHEFYFEFGAMAERNRDFELAAEMFRKSIDLVEEETPEAAAPAYNYLGYMWLEQGVHIDEAGELIKLANELLPDVGAYVDSLGWFHFVKGDYQAAVETLERANALLEAPDPVVLDHLAQALHKLGRIEEAIDCLVKAVALDPAEVTDAIRERLETYRRELAAAGVGTASPAGDAPSPH